MLTKAKVDAANFNWAKYETNIITKTPHLFDAQRFNWRDKSHLIPQYCPEHFDAELFNWENEKAQVAVCMFTPQFVERDRCPQLTMLKYCPHQVLPESMDYAMTEGAIFAELIAINDKATKVGYDLDGTLISLPFRLPKGLDYYIYSKPRLHRAWSRLRFSRAKAISKVNNTNYKKVIITARSNEFRKDAEKLLIRTGYSNYDLHMFHTVVTDVKRFVDIIGQWKYRKICELGINVFFDDNLACVKVMRDLAIENDHDKDIRIIHVTRYAN
jgi:hypothetical protein